MKNWKNLIHLFVTIFLSCFAMLVVNPAIADVTMDAVCPGQDECSLAIYLTGFQQAISGLGSVIVMPLIGTLSDVYGRKRMLAIPLTFSVMPLLIMSIKRTTHFFYAYYILKTLTSMVCEGGAVCISLSYLADNVSEAKRVTAIGFLCGTVSAATVVGTLTARLLPTAQIFQVAAAASILAVVYMRLFLKETPRPTADPLEVPILKSANDTTESVVKLSLPKEIIRLLQSSSTVSLASMIAFFNSLGEAGIQAFLMYYLKARFHFQKDEYADICLITFVGATFSSLVLMPTLGPIVGEETLLCVGLFAGFMNMLLNSIAWATWVPYASALLGVLLSLANPSIRSIVSKQVGPYEQGIAQGCLMGIAALANVASPVIFSPLSALFLSDDAPFKFPGFSMLCVGLAIFVGFVLSLVLKLNPKFSMQRSRSDPGLPAYVKETQPFNQPIQKSQSILRRTLTNRAIDQV